MKSNTKTVAVVKCCHGKTKALNSGMYCTGEVRGFKGDVR